MISWSIEQCEVTKKTEETESVSLRYLCYLLFKIFCDRDDANFQNGQIQTVLKRATQNLPSSRHPG